MAVALKEPHLTPNEAPCSDEKVPIRKTALPVDAILPAIVDSLSSSSIGDRSPSGRGQDHSVPPALLAMVSGDVVVLEPRRIAARLAARRVASELGEPWAKPSDIKFASKRRSARARGCDL